MSYEHGTYSGYQYHVMKGTTDQAEECGCRAAARAYSQQYRETKDAWRGRANWAARTRRQASLELAKRHPDEYEEILAEIRQRDPYQDEQT